MIRINLLPPEDRPASRRVSLPNTSVLLPVALFVMLAAPIGVSMLHQSKKLSGLQHAVAEAKEESIRLKPQIDRIHQLNKQTQELNHRINVVAELDTKSTYVVEILDAISDVMPKHMWLTRIEEDEKRAGTMIVEGVTFTNLAVADLMVRLEKTGYFDDVLLVIIEDESIDGREALRFEVEVRLTYGEKKEIQREHP
jgi:Tfp pilus assembly protein PilN